MIEMKISGIVLDPQSRSPIVVLRDMEDRRALLIWIGNVEANSIMLILEKIKLLRPITHDLINNIFQALNISLQHVLINDIQESTFFAQLHLKTDNGKYIIDTRPSDAIALALRLNSPIFVTEQVMASSSIPINPNQDEEDAQKFKRFIEKLKPSDFNIPDSDSAS